MCRGTCLHVRPVFADKASMVISWLLYDDAGDRLQYEVNRIKTAEQAAEFTNTFTGLTQ